MEPLVAVEPERWHLLMDLFTKDGPRGVAGYCLVDTQLRWWTEKLGPCMQMYSPFGNIDEGLVAINEKPGRFYEVIILSVKDEPDVLEEALVKTKIIDWKTPKIVPYAPVNIQQLVKRLTKRLGIVIAKEHPSFGFIRKKDAKPYELSCPDGQYFGKLQPEHVDMVDENWRYRHTGSDQMFRTLIRAGHGYGIFRRSDQRLLTWMLLSESGYLTHMCTADGLRRRGHAELMAKYTNNILQQEGRDSIGHSMFDNWPSLRLLLKLRHDVYGVVAWLEVEPKVDAVLKSKL